MEIKAKTFLITGGASGLGESTGRYLLGLGANIVAVDLNADSGSKLQNELGENCLFVQGNVTDEESIQNAINLAVKKFGAIHGAINCAGVATPGKLLDRDGNPLPLDTFKKVIDINLVGTFNVCRLVAAQILKQDDSAGDRGVLINTASVAAFEAQIGQVAYGASKGAVAAMTLPVAREMARHRIRVMGVAPGIFKTPMLAGLPQAAQDSLGAQVPYPSRLGEPQEYAQLVAHIIENEYLNGSVIRLDGSIRMAPK